MCPQISKMVGSGCFAKYEKKSTCHQFCGLRFTLIRLWEFSSGRSHDLAADEYHNHINKFRPPLFFRGKEKSNIVN